MAKSSHSEHTESIAVHADGHHGDGHGDKSLLDPNTSMVVLTWITFVLLLAVLNKFALKPILKALEQREKQIEDAVAHADKIKEELDNLDQKRAEILEEAQQKSKELIAQSRKAAQEAAHVIEGKAKDEAKILLENARREIKNEQEKAYAKLREDSADIAVAIASKLIDEHLDKKKNEKLINRVLEDL